MTTLAPIIIFVYNRPQHTKRAISALQKNVLAEESELFIYSDAPKNQSDISNVNEVRQYIREIEGFKKITVIERQQNIGLANNIIDGVTTIVNKYGRVIVLEDDLITSPYFLQFMNDALNTYQNETKIGHIQACDFTNDNLLPDTFLIKWTGSWGWATWARAWKFFNSDGNMLLNEISNKGLAYTFDFNGKYPYTKMLRRQIKGENNSWAIRWNASLFINDILSLNVGKSLVQNVGFDGSGTNCGGGNLYTSNLYMKKLTVDKISPIEENKEARDAYIRYYGRTNSFIAKIIRRMKRTLKGDFGR